MPRMTDEEIAALDNLQIAYGTISRELRSALKAERRENKRLEKCRQELIDVTNACRDPRVNLTHTLEECIRDAYDKLESKDAKPLG